VAAVTPFGRKVVTGTNANDATLLASGDAMPGAPSGTTLGASLVHVDPSGRFTLGAGVSGPDHFQGFWQGASAADLHPIVMTGGPAPGTNDTLDFIHTAAVNDAGQLAFVGDLTLNGTADGTGIFAYDPAIGLQLIARIGDTVHVGPGDVRTISALVHPDLFDTPALSDTGTLLFRVDFTDGSSGLMLADVPEPEALSLVILAAVCLVRRRTGPTIVAQS